MSQDKLVPQSQEMVQPANLLQAIVQISNNPHLTKESVDVLERMMAMQERLEMREAEKAFAVALARLQSKLPQIPKDGIIYQKDGIRIRSRYAKIEGIDAIIRPMLNEEGFAFSFDCKPTADPKIFLFSGTLSHKNGHSVTKSFPLPTDTNQYRSAIQDMGSSESFAKRRLIKMHLNIVEEGEDNDGQGSDAKITDRQSKDLRCKMEEVGQDEARFLRLIAGADRIDNILARDFDRCWMALEEKARARK